MMMSSQGVWPTLKMPPSSLKLIFPLNLPSAISSSYLLHGPRVGSWVWREGGRDEGGREGGRESGREREREGRRED